MCCSPWGHRELDTNEQLNNSLVNTFFFFFSVFQSKAIPYFVLMTLLSDVT